MINNGARKENGKDKLSYADVVKEYQPDRSNGSNAKENGCELVKWDGDGNDASWLKFCSVGVLKAFTDISPVYSRMKNRMMFPSSHYLGDKVI